jgi:hypothetical protein
VYFYKPALWLILSLLLETVVLCVGYLPCRSGMSHYPVNGISCCIIFNAVFYLNDYSVCCSVDCITVPLHCHTFGNVARPLDIVSLSLCSARPSPLFLSLTTSKYCLSIELIFPVYTPSLLNICTYPSFTLFGGAPQPSRGGRCNPLFRILSGYTWQIRDAVQLVPILAIAKGCIILLCAQLPDVPPSLSH